MVTPQRNTQTTSKLVYDLFMIFKQISTVTIFKSFVSEMRLDLRDIVNHIIHQKHIASIANILVEDYSWKRVRIKTSRF